MLTIDTRVHPNFFTEICRSDEEFEFRQQSIHLFNNGYESFEHTVNRMRLAGLDKLVLMGQDERSLYGRPVLTNDELSLLCRSHPDHFYAFACVDPRDETAAAELARAFSELQLQGLYLNLPKLGLYPDDARLAPLYELCIQYHKPLTFAAGASYEPGFASDAGRPIHYESVALQYPDLTFCLARFGWPWVQETAMLLLKYPQIYTDLGVLYFDSAKEFYTRLLTRDLDRSWVERSLVRQILFASENPRFEQIRMARAIRSVGLHEHTAAHILGLNAQRFLGLEEAKHEPIGVQP